MMCFTRRMAVSPCAFAMVGSAPCVSKYRTTANRKNAAATKSGVAPNGRSSALRGTWRSSTRYWTIARWPAAAAVLRGAVFRSGPCVVTPRAQRYLTTGRWPFQAASERGLWSIQFSRSSGAPRSANRCRIARFPASAARCAAVFSCSSVASTDIPQSSHRFTASTWFFLMASHNAAMLTTVYLLRALATRRWVPHDHSLGRGRRPPAESDTDTRSGR